MTAPRTCPTCGQAVAEEGPVRWARENRTVRDGEEIVHLEPIQAELFDLLWRRRPNVVAKATIYDHLYQLRPIGDQPEFRIVDVHIFRVRRELLHCHRVVISTAWGEGYWLQIRT